MSFLCGWASQSENGTANGKKGDQTGKEVKLGAYYDFGQTIVIRPVNVKKARLVAKAAKAFCLNNNIGYGQNDRTSLYTQCEKIKWDISKIKTIKTKCNCDCSELAACSINMAFGKAIMPSSTTTATLKQNTVGKYPKSFKAVKKSAKKKSGDMPLKAGHHVIVVLEDE